MNTNNYERHFPSIYLDNCKYWDVRSKLRRAYTCGFLFLFFLYLRLSRFQYSRWEKYPKLRTVKRRMTVPKRDSEKSESGVARSPTFYLHRRNIQKIFVSNKLQLTNCKYNDQANSVSN